MPQQVLKEALTCCLAAQVLDLPESQGGEVIACYRSQSDEASVEIDRVADVYH